MQEAFLHYVWKHKLFDLTPLKTTCGLPIKIIHSGEHNFHSGPDFHAARLALGETEWSGNIELHIKASEWSQHGHQYDPAYNNVILHVVYQHDREAFTLSGRQLPVLELKNRILPEAYPRFIKLTRNQAWIPCQPQIHKVPAMVWKPWLKQLMQLRLERRKDEWLRVFFQTHNDWDECLYRKVTERFGFGVNDAGFRMLAASLPYKYIHRVSDSLEKAEALLFGQAGLLNPNLQDPYGQQLFRDYSYMRHKWKLTPIPPVVWKTARMRPSNFPAVRLAQLAAFLQSRKRLTAQIKNLENVTQLSGFFSVKASTYWTTHYVLDKESKPRIKQISKSTAHNLIINTVVPFLYVYGMYRQEQKYIDRARILAEQLKAETNHIIRSWNRLNIQAQHAAESQALLELHNDFCKKKKCLNCEVAAYLLKI